MLCSAVTSHSAVLTMHPKAAPQTDFDPSWYRSYYTDVDTVGMDPLAHYHWIGRELGRAPNRRFLRAPGIPHLRVAVFAAYDAAASVRPHVVHYLRALSKVCDHVVFVADNALSTAERKKIEPLVGTILAEAHGEYDFGSYKRGFNHLEAEGLLIEAKELVLCNDSCLGPVGDLSHVFAQMAEREVDFWGLTGSSKYNYHLQSYFLCLKRCVFTSDPFRRFVASVEREPSVREVILNYELGLTPILQGAGFRAGAYITSLPPGFHRSSSEHQHIEHFPRFLLSAGSPLVKIKGFTKPDSNLDGIAGTLAALRASSTELFDIVSRIDEIGKYARQEDIAFSVIMPTRNRAHCIARAIASVLAQSHQNFELIVVDDASTDHTHDLVTRAFRKEIETNRLTLIRIEEHVGVSAARNRGLDAARNPWIAYADSDNAVRPYFLTLFAQHIIHYPDSRTFYAQLRRIEDGVVTGRPFDYQMLLWGNFIDLGTFVHHRSCYEILGGFDDSLRRLVDWDLILAYAKKFEPVFISHVVLDYTNGISDRQRISRNECAVTARLAILRKRTTLPVVTTLVLSYNHESYIAKALDSALAQRGPFIHEIVVSDDGSTDGTREIIEQYKERHQAFIRCIGDGINVGISANFKRSFEAAGGEYLAVLEGDDYWTDATKLATQLAFLADNPDSSMVFSKIEMHNIETGKRRFLKRQEMLTKSKLTADDFLASDTMNLIANFSSCMFRKNIMTSLPAEVFEPRFNEITLAFWLDHRHGPIGYIDKPMSVYQKHSQGAWNGDDRRSQLETRLAIRLSAKKLAAARHRAAIQKAIDEHYLPQLKALGPASGPSSETS